MEKTENQYRKGFWTEEEDKILMDYINVHGKGRWNHIAKKTGLRRCGKSCRLRWLNYLSPNVKKGNFTEQEEDIIIRLHNLLGNRWSLIAKRVPGRTDNQVKNYWNTHLTKKLAAAADAKDKNGRRLQIKDQSRNAIAVSSSTNSSKEPTNSCFTEFANRVTTPEFTVDVAKGNIQEANYQESETQEQIIFNDIYASSFWFLDDAIGNEFLDGYSFDLS